MVWCTCPIRCKGGREVTARTRSKHEKELKDQEDQRIIQQWFPGRPASLSDARRRRADDDDDGGGGAQGHNKRLRGNYQQADETETHLVRDSTSLSQRKLTSQQPVIQDDEQQAADAPNGNGQGWIVVFIYLYCLLMPEEDRRHSS